MSVRIRAASRMRRLAAASVGAAALVLVPSIASVGQTEAAWVNSEYASTTVTTATVTVVKGTCPLTNPNLAGDMQTVTFNWSYPAASSTVIVPTSIRYTIARPDGTLAVDTTVAVTGSPLGPTSYQTTVAASGALGTYTMTVYPIRSTWSTGSTVTWNGPTISYSLVIAQRTLGARYFASCA